jgi:hypothetical protein
MPFKKERNGVSHGGWSRVRSWVDLPRQAFVHEPRIDAIHNLFDERRLRATLLVSDCGIVPVTIPIETPDFGIVPISDASEQLDHFLLAVSSEKIHAQLTNGGVVHRKPSN